MSRSVKKNPVTTFVVCKSQKAGKVECNRRFRRIAKAWLKCGRTLPVRTREVMDQYDLGGDGKARWFSYSDEFIKKIKRK